MEKEKYYISTAIAYASGKPHIGNTYEIVLADAIARNKRLEGFDVYFQTGTDEHGEKIELKAKDAGLTPQEFVDKTSSEIKRIWDIMNTTYDRFVRTSDPDHKKKVQHIFKKLYDQGDIYLDKYEGWYCTPCESFFTETQIIDGNCPDCGRPVDKKSEEAYFFRLSKYQDKLMKYIEQHPEFIEPEARKNEMINNFLKPGLQDLCVSRTAFDWGVKVDFNDKHVIYVWIDALSNYITFPGFDIDNQTEFFKKYWPADLHLIGKDIIRFHTIYWPIILMALGVELPKQVFGHPWLLTSSDKMSKSKGNVLYADDLVNKYGLDTIRYYVLHEIPFADDGNITEDLIAERNNSDLANILGNLVNRTIAMSHKYFGGYVENTNINEEIDNKLIDLCENLGSKVKNNMDKLRIADSITDIFNVLRASNKYIDETTPWVLAKDETKKDRLKTVLYNLIESIRISAVYLQPFMPDTSAKIFDLLNTDLTSYESTKKFGAYKSGTKLKEPQILFERIEIGEK